MSLHTVDGAARAVNQFVPLTINRVAVVVHLTKGKHAAVDVADFPAVSRHSWYAMQAKHHRTWYAATRTGGRVLLMHRMLKGEPAGKLVDHEDRNGLNNRQHNLRIATHAQNQANSAKARSNSGFKGVYRLGKSYVAYIRPNRRKIHLGCFPNAEDAARAYDAKAHEVWGEFARVNFPGSSLAR